MQIEIDGQVYSLDGNVALTRLDAQPDPTPDPDPSIPDPTPDPDPAPNDPTDPNGPEIPGPTPPPDAPPTDADSAPGNQFYDELVLLPSLHSAAHLRHQPNVTENVYFSRKERATTHYDPDFDAARMIHPAGWGSIVGGDQIRHSFPVVNDGQLLLLWQSLMPRYWEGGRGGLTTQKAFQIARTGAQDAKALEPRYRYSQADGVSGAFARADVRTYISGGGGPFDSIPQQGEYMFKSDVWNNFAFLVDIANRELSYFVTGPGDYRWMPVLNRAPYGGEGGFDQLWLEHNSSQSRVGEPEAYAFGRNIVTLRNTSFNEMLNVLRMFKAV